MAEVAPIHQVSLYTEKKPPPQHPTLESVTTHEETNSKEQAHKHQMPTTVLPEGATSQKFKYPRSSNKVFRRAYISSN